MRAKANTEKVKKNIYMMKQHLLKKLTGTLRLNHLICGLFKQMNNPQPPSWLTPGASGGGSLQSDYMVLVVHSAKGETSCKVTWKVIQVLSASVRQGWLAPSNYCHNTVNVHAASLRDHRRSNWVHLEQLATSHFGVYVSIEALAWIDTQR